MRIISLIVCTLLVFVAPRQAIAVNITLNTEISDESVLQGLIDDTTTELILSGRVSANLLKQIPLLAPNLERIDLSALDLSPSLIPDYAFAASSIKSITLPDNLSSIGEAAFAGSRLEKIAINAPIDSISPYTFSECSMLSEVSLPESVKKIGRRAFAGCQKIYNLKFPSQLQSIADEAFTASGIKTADLKLCDQLTRIGGYAFASCPDIERVDLPIHIIYIGEGAFLNCKSLKALTGGISVPAVAPLMLAATPELESAAILNEGSNVNEIGDYALSGATSIKGIYIPSTLQFIGEHAMERMNGLEHIDATAVTEIPSLGDNVWHQTPQSDINLTASDDMADRFRTTPQWNQFIIIGDNISSIQDIDGNSNEINMRFEGDNMVVSSTAAINQITVYDLGGRVRLNSTGINSNEAVVPASEWNSPGAYIINIHTDGRKAVRQIIRQ